MRFVLILLLTWLPLLACAVDFDENTRTLTLGRSVQVLEDPSGNATIEEVSSASQSGLFRRLDTGTLNAGFSRSAFWLKVDLRYRPRNPAAHADWLLELAYPPMDHVDLYAPDEAGVPRLAWQTGDMLPFSSRQIKQNNFLFELNLPPDQLKTFYLRVASHGSIQAPLNLWSSHAYLEAQPARIYVFGLIYGVLLGMLFYNLFIYLSVRDVSYLYYILYIASFGLYQVSVNGAGIEFIWPDNPWWANASTTFFVGASILFACQFSRLFLHTATLVRWLDRLLLLLIAGAVSVMVLSVTVDYGIALRLATGLVLAFTVVLFTTGVTAWCKGLRAARYFIIAWTAFLVGGLINTFMLMGYLPNTFFTMYSSQLGSVLEVALLSLALADRINAARMEQAQTLYEAGQNLERMNRQLEISNRLKDEFLATLTHELRTPMNGIIGSLELMRTVKMDNELGLYQQTAASSAQDMMGIVDGILTLTELQAGKLRPECAPFSLRRLFAQLRCSFGERAFAKGLEFNLDLDKHLRDDLYGDAGKLQQCVECLLDNAIKFTKTGAITLRVTGVVQDLQNVQLLIEVLDSGIGFQRLDEATLYQRFFQVDGSMTREYGGLGIGLAICRQMIELLGGRLSHRSVPGQGSCFALNIQMGLADVPTGRPMPVMPVRSGK